MTDRNLKGRPRVSGVVVIEPTAEEIERLSLRVVNDMAKERGVRVSELAQRLPDESLSDMLERLKRDAWTTGREFMPHHMLLRTLDGEPATYRDELSKDHDGDPRSLVLVTDPYHLASDLAPLTQRGYTKVVEPFPQFGVGWYELVMHDGLVLAYVELCYPDELQRGDEARRR